MITNYTVKLFSMAAIVFCMLFSCNKDTEVLDGNAPIASSTNQEHIRSQKDIHFMISSLTDTITNDFIVHYDTIAKGKFEERENDTLEYTYIFLKGYTLHNNKKTSIEFDNITPFLLLDNKGHQYFAKFITSSDSAKVIQTGSFLKNGSLILKDLSNGKSHIYSYIDGAVIQKSASAKNMAINSVICREVMSCNWYTVCQGVVHFYGNRIGECSYPTALTNCDYSAPWERASPTWHTVCEDIPDPEPPTSGGGGGGGDGGSGGNNPGTGVPPNAAELAVQLVNKPLALMPSSVPCSHIRQWLALAKFQVGQAELDHLKDLVRTTTTRPGITTETVARLQDINNAYSQVVNMDYFALVVTRLPKIFGREVTAAQFLEHVRKSLNQFVDTDNAEFMAYPWFGEDNRDKWTSFNPLGSVVAIDIAGPDNGSVIVSNSSANKWIFSTIFDPYYGLHPVSGHREFGYEANANGTYTFYVRGVDRLTDISGEALRRLSTSFVDRGIPFNESDKLWRSFQTKLNEFIYNNGGLVGNTYSYRENPNWQLVKDVLDGKTSLSALSKDCPD